ncbi:MAG: hypothetical protein ACOCWM_01025 [Cyclobacteriaceae bacterium]
MSNAQATTDAIKQISLLFQDMSQKSEIILKNIQPAAMPIEQIKPLYHNNEMLSQLPTVFRYAQHGNRFYFTLIDDTVEFYPSVTTIIGRTTPMSFGLKKILGDKGLDGYFQFMRERAAYGTFLHIQISDYLKYQEYDFDQIRGKLAMYLEDKQLDVNLEKWSEDCKKDMASLIQFCIDHEVKPIAIEVVGTYSDKNVKMAGAIDMICEMTVKEKGFHGEVYKSGEKKGEPKETIAEKKITAIVDFKSGKSGFFEEHEIQLHMYKLIAEQSMNIKIDKVFNVAPKDWLTMPTYTVKDQTDSPKAAKIPHMIAQFLIDYEGPKDILQISGKQNGEDLSKTCRHIPAAEYVKSFSKINI